MSRKNLAIVLSFLYLPPLCLLDIMTGSDLSLLVLYLLPIGACAYYGGKAPAIGISALALAAWVLADFVMPNDVDLPRSTLLVLGTIEKAVVFAVLIVLVLKMKSYIDAERSRALHDPVTGLLNRRAFDSDLARAIAAAEPFCLAFMEVEGLEELYLDRGEAFVDSLLKRMAAVCRVLAPGYRYSDQRFAAIMPGLGGEDASKRMSSLAAELGQVASGSAALVLVFKVGIAHCGEAGTVSPPQLVRRLQGCMIHLHGKAGDQVEAFEFR
jgi:GGDEF domain-containing protein